MNRLAPNSVFAIDYTANVVLELMRILAKVMQPPAHFGKLLPPKHGGIITRHTCHIRQMRQKPLAWTSPEYFLDCFSTHLGRIITKNQHHVRGFESPTKVAIPRVEYGSSPLRFSSGTYWAFLRSKTENGPSLPKELLFMRRSSLEDIAQRQRARTARRDHFLHRRDSAPSRICRSDPGPHLRKPRIAPR